LKGVLFGRVFPTATPFISKGFNGVVSKLSN